MSRQTDLIREALLRHASTCTFQGSVTRQGETGACGRPAIALVRGDEEFPNPWPACSYHARRMSAAVGLITLDQIVEALR
ncbi:hypothetical protein GCM10027298_22220 [Epidermidibacterium keratini]